MSPGTAIVQISQQTGNEHRETENVSKNGTNLKFRFPKRRTAGRSRRISERLIITGTPVLRQDFRAKADEVCLAGGG